MLNALITFVSCSVKNYDDIWIDLPAKSHFWNRVLIPKYCVFDMGASEAIYSRVPEHKILNTVSPIVLRKAKKNAAERAGMRKAHIIDGAAMCETLSYIEQRVSIRMNDTLLLCSQAHRNSANKI